METLWKEFLRQKETKCQAFLLSRIRADTFNFSFVDLLFVVIIRQNQPFRRRRRHLALFATHVLEYISARDARKLATLANGHGPLGRLPVGFRAKSAIFLASVEKSCFSRCDAGALAVGELVSRTDKDSTASYG